MVPADVDTESGAAVGGVGEGFMLSGAVGADVKEVTKSCELKLANFVSNGSGSGAGTKCKLPKGSSEKPCDSGG